MEEADSNGLPSEDKIDELDNEEDDDTKEWQF